MPALTIHCASRLARRAGVWWGWACGLPLLYPLILTLMLAGLPAVFATAADGCSRAIMVPVSPLGTAMMIGKNQEISGIMVTMLREVERRSQCPVQFFIVPRVRAMQMFMQGEVDVLPSAIQTPERDQVADFIHTMDIRAVAVGLKGRLETLGLPASLLTGQYTVNVLRGYDYGAEYRKVVDTLRAQGRLEDVVDPETLVRKMAAGRASVALAPAHVLYHAAEQQGLSERMTTVAIDSITPQKGGFYVSTRALSADDRKRLQSVLADLKREQYQWKLLQRTLPPWALVGAKPPE